MASRAWLVDGRAFARKVTNASRSVAHQIKDEGANRECPSCHCRIDNSDVFPEWPGLPAGVKFDPSGAELLHHLAAKCETGNLKPHAFIEEFIPTLDGEEGIYYTHPENLPGAKKDGSSIHFFHRTVNAYATGQRKRRKIHNQHCSTGEVQVRWHKTGKTKPVIENGVQKGFKKIMVLYGNVKNGSKPEKCNWVMHQYHLGTEEVEDEYVVSKIFYQKQDKIENNGSSSITQISDDLTPRTSPKTPNPNPPYPRRPGKSVISDDAFEDNMFEASVKVQESESTTISNIYPRSSVEVEMEYPTWLAGESQVVESHDDLNDIDDSLLCYEMFESYSGLNHIQHTDVIIGNTNELTANNNNNNISYGISELVNLELDTPPDFDLARIQL